MKLHDIQPAAGSRKRRKRLGIGISAGQGKTSGRGQKGQASRSGGVKKGYFEGGQLPLVRKLPFARGVGFSNPYRIEYAIVSLGDLAQSFEAGAEVTPEALVAVGLLDKDARYVAILSNGEVGMALKVKAHKFSASAKSKIEQAGGSVEKIDVKRGGYRTR